MTDTIAAQVAAALAEKPMSALEDIASMAGTTVAGVVRNLPEGEAVLAGGQHFVAAMQDMKDWGEVTLIVNTGDVILEVKAPLPDGSLGRGFYNLHGKPAGGHLKADACDFVAFVSRKFMGKDTHSVQFYGKNGPCMFKVYLGRGADRDILPGQAEAFKALRTRLTAA